MSGADRPSRGESDAFRSELASAVANAFRSGAPTKWDVIEAAIRGRARPEILLALVGIPDRAYPSVTDLVAAVEFAG